MSLDVYLVNDDRQVYWSNITHNLGVMADHAEIYKPLWRPEEMGISKAHELIPHLENGIRKMVDNPSFYESFNAPNGWGLYENFLPWCCKLLEACRKNPTAKIEISR